MTASLKADPKRGQRLKELRQRRGLTQVQLAHELGVEKSTVSRWETGEVFPRDNLRALCQLHGCDPEYITFGIEAADDVETYPAFEEFLEWLQGSPYEKITPKWMVEALRTLRPRLPADVEPNLEVYKHLHQAMLAMPRRK
jgi:transcriptional regulator with XRE-family HTH domain